MIFYPLSTPSQLHVKCGAFSGGHFISDAIISFALENAVGFKHVLQSKGFAISVYAPKGFREFGGREKDI